MTPDLIAFLRACLDEEERVAQVATPGPWRIDARNPNVVREPAPIDWVGVAGHRLDMPPIFTGQTSSRARSQWIGDARHIAAWDPARVLAEIAAKRAILDHLDLDDAGCEDCGVPDDVHLETCQGYRPNWQIARLLAQPYRGWPGWSDDWAVET